MSDYFIGSVIGCGLISLVATGWFFRGANVPQTRWTWFFIIWVGLVILNYVLL